MKTTHRNTLLAALLVCLAPAAASATEAHMGPNSNGGSGAMPSGYTKLHFELGNGDWVSEVKLPANPRQGDVVVLSSWADWASKLDTANTSFANLLSMPIDSQTHIELRWSGARSSWYVIGGTSARLLTLHQSGEATVPMSNHLMTDVFTSVSKQINAVNLPQWAPQGAQLAFTSGQANDVEMRDGSRRMSCAATQTCTYIFSDLDGKWHARVARLQFQPNQEDLPEPTARLMDVVVGSVAEDLTTPHVLRLPANAVDGDLYRLSNPSGDHFALLMADHSDLSIEIKLPTDGVTFKYDAATRTWRR
ncbi:hypothetical protein [Stenotrophomonas maltophilia]|uniref:hypothetical protein n=1 Tax=Stenotrophomonas maltophilia TaxID=40324 RepID=UPI00050A1E05|nr:hypothetical protein [Stenotrophomonas maltophilia]KGM22927.1 hypothetical protein LI87_0114660 [Stenotrophomonas maltophilia]